MSITDRDGLIAAYATGRSYTLSQSHTGASITVTANSAGQYMSQLGNGRTRTYASPLNSPYLCTSATPGCPAPYPAADAGKDWYIGAVNLCDASGSSGMAVIFDRLAQLQLNPSAANNLTISMGRPSRSTSALGVYAYVEIASSTGNVAANNGLTLTYTNHAGVPNRTASFSVSNLTPTSAGAFIRFPLQAGDRGVSSIEKIVTTTAWSQQSTYLVLAKALHVVPYGATFAMASHGFMDIGSPRIGADAYLMMACTGLGQRYVDGTIRLIQG